jgi:hypothetical protein
MSAENSTTLLGCFGILVQAFLRISVTTKTGLSKIGGGIKRAKWEETTIARVIRGTGLTVN